MSKAGEITPDVLPSRVIEGEELTPYASARWWAEGGELTPVASAPWLTEGDDLPAESTNLSTLYNDSPALSIENFPREKFHKTKATDWAKKKGEAMIEKPNGKTKLAEVHW